MAQRGIREFDGKRILHENWKDFFGSSFHYSFKAVGIGPSTELDKVAERHRWLGEEELVAKPDVLLNNRGQLGLILARASWPQVKEWIEAQRGKVVEVNGEKGIFDHFIVEAYIPHDVSQERYVAIKMEAEGDRIFLSERGGVNIEERWDEVRQIFIPVLQEERAGEIIEKGVPENFPERKLFAEFLSRLYQLFCKLHFTYLEINPLLLMGRTVYPLDFMGKIDDTAFFLAGRRWGQVHFPSGFGREPTPEEEEKIKAMDENSGASLKFVLLNPSGRIWTLVAGGGASLVYADTIADLGYAEELANYGEYSGNPSRQETRDYSDTVLELMTRNEVAPKVLIIGGAIANFTDISATLDGIIEALKAHAEKLRKQRVKIFVRRGGPNYQEGLRKIKEAAMSLSIPIEVYGPEEPMTSIVRKAIDYLKGGGHED